MPLAGANAYFTTEYRLNKLRKQQLQRSSPEARQRNDECIHLKAWFWTFQLKTFPGCRVGVLNFNKPFSFACQASSSLACFAPERGTCGGGHGGGGCSRPQAAKVVTNFCQNNRLILPSLGCTVHASFFFLQNAFSLSPRCGANLIWLQSKSPELTPPPLIRNLSP